MGNESNKSTIFSLIFAILALAAYISSILVLNFMSATSPGFFVYIFGIFGLGGVFAIIGLILGIIGIRKQRLKVLAITCTIICCLVLAAVLYSGGMMLFV